MKNQKFEYNRRSMKEYHKTKRTSQFNADGIKVFHDYSLTDPDSFSYWDDAQFIKNNYRVMVWWTHPRCQYINQVEDIAHSMFPYPKGERFLEDSKPIYKPMGKHGKRKKAKWFEMGESKPEFSEWYNNVRRAEEELLPTSEIVIVPSFKIETFNYCKGISFCAPVEVRNEQELATMAMMTKVIMEGKASLEEFFEDYTYCCEDWKKERCVNSPFYNSHAMKT